MEEVMNEGRREGLQEGRQEGLQEGRRESLREVILHMLKSGENSLEKIAAVTGIPLNEVKRLSLEQK